MSDKPDPLVAIGKLEERLDKAEKQLKEFDERLNKAEGMLPKMKRTFLWIINLALPSALILTVFYYGKDDPAPWRQLIATIGLLGISALHAIAMHGTTRDE